MTILVLDNEIDPTYRYLGPEIQHHLPDAEYHVYPDDPLEAIPTAYDGVVLSGSTASVYDAEPGDWMETQRALIRRLRDDRVPILGICFGHQIVNDAFGGTVEKDRRRATFVEMEVVAECDILDDVTPIVPVLHGDLVTSPGTGMIRTARTEYNEYFCTSHESSPIVTVQFHPEFTRRVVDRPSDWSPGEYSFEDSTATRVIANFNEFVRRNRIG